MHFLPSIGISGIDSLITRHGEDANQILLEAGIDPLVLTSPDYPIDGQVFVDAIEKIARRLNQRFLGLQLAEIQGGTVLGPLWFLLRNSSSIGENIDNLVLNYPIHTDASFFAKEVHSDGITVIYDFAPDIKGDHTQAIDLALGIGSLSLRDSLGQDWRPKSVYLRTPEPYEMTPYVRVFGENIFFNQEFNGVFITNDELNVTPRKASQLRQHFFEFEHKKRMDFNPRSTLVQVEHIIHSSLSRYSCSLEFVAKCLNIKPRTLQYHLRQEGTSFSNLLNKAKLNLALRYLEQSNLSMTEISQRLHFSESAAFTRFIKRHTGKRPGEHRSRGAQ